MAKSQIRTTPQEFLDGDLVYSALDGYGRLEVVIAGGGVGGGDASAANQLTQITAEQAIQAAVEAIELTSAETAQFQKQPSYYRIYNSIPVGGLDLTTVYPGKVCVRIETYGDGILVTKPLGDIGITVTDDTYYGWSWFQSSATIEDTTTAFPLKVYWA